MDISSMTHSETQAPFQYTLVETNDGFHSIMNHLRGAKRLAVDIEADSLYHYFEKVCLIQISTDRKTFIIDPLSVTAIGKLAPIMADPAVEKVFHAAGYDLYCLRRDYGFVFSNIFDTHMAASLLGYEFLGLSAMMEKLLGVFHSKRRQRDDWSRRPLVAEQLEYAAMDTHHLLRLRDALEAELRQKDRLDWALEEFAAEAAETRPEKEFDPDGYRRIKGFRSLDICERMTLRALYLLRDAAARELDAPSFKVLNNSALIDLARRPPRNAQELFKRPGVSFRVARKFGNEIIRVIEDAEHQDPAILQLPPRCTDKIPGRVARRLMEMLKAWRLEKSKEFNLPAGVIFPANLLENLAANPPEELNAFTRFSGIRRWRVRLFGQELLQLFQQQQSCEPTAYSLDGFL